MMTLIQDTLTLWRDAERVLDRLPPASRDHQTVELLVVELRDTYTRLTTARDWSPSDLATSREALEAARDLLSRVDGGWASGAPELSSGET